MLCVYDCYKYVIHMVIMLLVPYRAVFIRQNLTSVDGPRAERVKVKKKGIIL